MTNKVRVVAAQGIKDKGFISFGDFCLQEASLVCEVHFRWDSAGVQARRLRIQLQIYGFIRLDTDDEFITSDILKDSLGDVLELNPDFDLAFIKGCQDSVIALDFASHNVG